MLNFDFGFHDVAVRMIWSSVRHSRRRSDRNAQDSIRSSDHRTLSTICFKPSFLPSLDYCSDPQSPWLRVRDKHILITIHSLPRGLEQLKTTPPVYRRERDIHLRVRERHPQAAPRAFPKTNHVSREVLAIGRFGCVEPPLGLEGETVREQVFVVGDREVGHGDDGARGEDI